MKWFAHSNVFSNVSALTKVYTFAPESIYSWGMKVYTFSIRKYILLMYESIYFWYVKVYTF